MPRNVITMRRKDYLREHHHLFKVLAHPTKKALKKELLSQKKELKERGLKGGRFMSRKYCKKTPCRRMGFTQRASCRPYKNCY